MQRKRPESLSKANLAMNNANRLAGVDAGRGNRAATATKQMVNRYGEGVKTLERKYYPDGLTMTAAPGAQQGQRRVAGGAQLVGSVDRGKRSLSVRGLTPEQETARTAKHNAWLERSASRRPGGAEKLSPRLQLGQDKNKAMLAATAMEIEGRAGQADLNRSSAFRLAGINQRGQNSRERMRLDGRGSGSRRQSGADPNQEAWNTNVDEYGQPTSRSTKGGKTQLFDPKTNQWGATIGGGDIIAEAEGEMPEQELTKEELDKQYQLTAQKTAMLSGRQYDEGGEVFSPGADATVDQPPVTEPQGGVQDGQGMALDVDPSQSPVSAESLAPQKDFIQQATVPTFSRDRESVFRPWWESYKKKLKKSQQDTGNTSRRLF